MAGMSWAEGLRTRTAAALAVGWSLFQLWYVSPLPFALGVLVINDGTARAIHLAFALALVFLAGGGRAKTETATGGRLSWLFAGAGVATTLYLVAFDDALAVRAGLPNTVDLLIGALGLVLLLEATRLLQREQPAQRTTTYMYHTGRCRNVDLVEVLQASYRYHDTSALMRRPRPHAQSGWNSWLVETRSC